MKKKVKKESSPKKEARKKTIINFLVLLFGAFSTAVATACLLIPNGLSVCGVTGLAVIIETLTGISYIYSYYFITAIIVILTLIIIGKKEVGKILFLAIVYPTFLGMLEILDIKIILDDPLLAAIIYSLLSGFGSGLTYRLGFSFGGSDSLAKVIQVKLFPFLTLGNIMLVLDLIVLIALAFTLGINVALYILVIKLLFTKTIDYVAIGMGRTLYKHDIITSKPEEISNYIMTELGRGITRTSIIGEFTKEEKIQITCICSPKESFQIRKIISEFDKSAFVEVIPVYDVWGNGKKFRDLDE